jgi:hypothetical protein
MTVYRYKGRLIRIRDMPKTNPKYDSHIFLGVLAVAAVAGGAYLYLNNTSVPPASGPGSPTNPVGDSTKNPVTGQTTCPPGFRQVILDGAIDCLPVSHST